METPTDGLQTHAVRRKLGSLQLLQQRKPEAADVVGAAVRHGAGYETVILPYSQEVRSRCEYSRNACSCSMGVMSNVLRPNFDP